MSKIGGVEHVYSATRHEGGIVVSAQWVDTMFFRVKKAKAYHYLQTVENHREVGRVKQRVITTLGRLHRLQDSGYLETLLQSGGPLCRGG